MNPVRIAILASGTMTGMPAVLSEASAKIGIPVEVSLGGYNQYAQEILNPKSELYASNPELVILALCARSLLAHQYLHPYQADESARRAWAAQTLEHLTGLTSALLERTTARIILHNLEVPLHSPLGILETKQLFGFHESLQWLNGKLRDCYRSEPRVLLFDYDAFAASLGKHRSLDDKLYYLGDISVNPQWMEPLALRWLAYIRPLRVQTKKCIVLDCDNTLWGGVVGEEGIEGIALGPTPQGRPFLEFQQYLLSLYDRGIILALNSRNNPDDVATVLREHPHMLLREHHFAGVRLNWEDKVSNMRSLAEELNIGMDSLVFLDDDPLNRGMVREMLPEVSVVELPKDPALYVRTLLALDEFSAFELTEEDRRRGTMYAQDRQRRAVAATTGSLDDYLRTLELTVRIQAATAMTIPRIAQLTQKTNQFNMTARRYSEAEVSRLHARGDMLVLSLAAMDKFGDNGLTGVAIIDRSDPMAWRVDTFLLSCRVLGRRIEHALLWELIARARRAGARTLIGEFIPTAKNAPAKGFYANNGFTTQKQEGEVEHWVYSLERPYPLPEAVKLETEEFTV